MSPHLVHRAHFAIPAGSITLTDQAGTPIRHVRVHDMHRRWVPLDDISPIFLQAMLVAEDARYYEHAGVDFPATIRAIGYAVSPTRKHSGASTITQQTVKLTFGRPWGRWSKPLEILRALALEQEMDKDEILEQYVNRLPYADNITGISRASESYFGKPPSRLGLAEAALLAGLPQAPTRLDPRRDLEAARARRDIVLRRMFRLGVIDREALQDAMSTPVRVQSEARPWRAPRFADRVLGAYRHGEVETDERGHVRTTLDVELQAKVEELMRAALERYAGRGVTNGAAIVVDNQSGEVRAYVGAADPHGPGGAMDLLEARRQPGSTLKPFVYGLLFERGGTPATVLDDVVSPMTGGDGEVFEARDYDGRERGPVRARAALAASLNLAALDAARRVGAERIVDRLGALGVRDLESAQQYGAAIALGGVDVRPIDMARAYVTLARGGTRVGLRFVPRSTRSAAIRLDTSEPASRAVLQEPAAALITDVLSDAAARRDGFGRDLVDLAAGDFALKTGTSSGFRDVWSAAYTRDVTVVVWLGDPEGRPLDEVSGFSAAAPIAARIIAEARPDEEGTSSVVAFDRSTDWDVAPICPLSGARPGPSCPHAITERFERGSAPRHVCAFHVNGSTVLPARFAAWQRRVRLAGTRIEQSSDEGRLRIVRPRDGTRMVIDPRRAPLIGLRATLGGSFATDVQWSVDGQPIASAWRPTPGEHQIEARWGDRETHADVSVALP